MNKLRPYFRVICAPIRSWSEISAQHFPSFRQAISVFGGPKFRAGGPKLCIGSLICTSSKFCLAHLGLPLLTLSLDKNWESHSLVTISAMPPVDYYIHFYWKTMTGPRYYNGRGISRPNVEMNCNDIFMRHISGARGMLKSLRNHRQS